MQEDFLLDETVLLRNIRFYSKNPKQIVFSVPRMILDAFNTVNSPEALFPPHIWLIVFVVMLYFLPGCLHLFPILFAPSPQISILRFLVIIQGDGSSDLSRHLEIHLGNAFY
uniref:Uncharacterized protein n=1 Tax=Populus davidiana TaxID=266767 RepID=A0A6M2EGE7_9ROSI